MLTLLALLATQPGILRTIDLPLADPAAPKAQGGALVVWPIACEASGECTPAKLFLPDSAQSPLGDGTTASMFLSRLGKCFKSDTRRAPDVVTAAVKSGDEDALKAELAKQAQRTVVVVARESWDGGHNFDVSLHLADDGVPLLSPSAGVLRLSLVRAPHAKAVAHAVAHKQWRSALALAKHAYVHARAGDEKIRAAGNYAVAAVLAGDKAAAADAAQAAQDPLDAVLDDATTTALQSAYDDIANADSFATGAVLISDPCS
jgi:hypothetical protein